jgi:hypothetical protein
MDEEKIIREAMGTIKLPSDVKKFDLKFSPDSTGVPSVWINLHITDDSHPSEAKINRLRNARRAIADKLFATELNSWPYVKIVAD